MTPPTLDLVGQVAHASIQADGTTVYSLIDGRSFEEPEGGRRLLTFSSLGQLLIVGADAQGGFIATYDVQQGLPQDCYVDNSAGVDRGDYVELRGVLWKKSASFAPAVSTASGQPYPDSTRFCFAVDGTVSRTIAAT